MIGLYYQQEICKRLCCCCKSNCNRSVQSIENGEPQPEQFELLPVAKNEDSGSEYAV